MTLIQALAVLAAGAGAGAVNTVVGSGTLITFPVLLAMGLNPVVANVSNAIGLVPGSAAGAVGLREDLRGQGPRLRRLALASVSGAVAGAVLLLTLPGSAFGAIVPVFILASLVLVVAQPRIGALLARRRAGGAPREAPLLLSAGVLVAGIYGGYFGAAQGILLLAILGVAYADPIGRINALKVVLAGLVNLTSGVCFALVAHVNWTAAGLVAGGSILGGWLGARWGRRLPPAALRGVIVVVGLIAVIRLA